LLNNCTVAGNSAGTSSNGGGVHEGTVNNCIVYFNSAPNVTYYQLNYSCTTPAPGGSDNISGDPQFVNAAGGDFRLQAGSPCINQGNNTYAPGSADLDNNPRIVGTAVDMGAYEYQGASTVTLTASCEANGISTVTPASTNVAIGGSAVFTIDCSQRFFRILDIKTNGVSVGLTFDSSSPITPTNFTWSNVQAAGSLYVTFTDRVTSDPGHPTFTWLSEHGLTRDTNAVNGSMSDTDHDGMTAWQEYVAGTDPTNAGSVFHLTGVVSSNGTNTLKWTSSASARGPYNLYYSTNLTTGVWTLYSGNIVADPPTNSLSLPMPQGTSARFYKVSITNF
jgi:hypothetical protein